MYDWIDTTDKLNSHLGLLLEAAQEKVIHLAIDTEFIRENTYFPQLCLIQMAWDNHVVLIDPLALGEELAPLKEILAHPRIIKILHSARQDLEIFWLLFKTLPAPFYDTQIAAMVCGYGESIAYNMLIEHLLGTPLDKASRLTDWSKRPLNKDQCQYAIADVTYLLKAYALLTQRIEAAGRDTWIEEETQALLDPALYEPAPATAWQKIRANRLRPQSVEALKAMAAYREGQAIEKNVPKTRLIKDDALVELATHLPDSLEQLKRMRGLPPTLRNNPFISQLMCMMAAAKKTPAASGSKDFVQERILPSKYEGLLDLLRMLLKIISEQEKVAAKILANKHDLEQLIFHTLEGAIPRFEHPLLEGWRFDLFGKQATQVILGQEGLFCKNGRIVCAPLA